MNVPVEAFGLTRTPMSGFARVYVEAEGLRVVATLWISRSGARWRKIGRKVDLMGVMEFLDAMDRRTS